MKQNICVTGVAIIDAGNIVALDSPGKLVDNLLATGFERPKEMKLANLEDVFISLTGHSLREGKENEHSK